MKKLIVSLIGIFCAANSANATTLAEVLQASIDLNLPVEITCDLSSSGEKVSFNVSAELSKGTQLGTDVTYDMVLINPFLGGFSIQGDHITSKQYGRDYDVDSGKLSRLTFGKPNSPIHISNNPLEIQRLFVVKGNTSLAPKETGYSYINCSTSID